MKEEHKARLENLKGRGTMSREEAMEFHELLKMEEQESANPHPPQEAPPKKEEAKPSEGFKSGLEGVMGKLKRKVKN